MHRLLESQGLQEWRQVLSQFQQQFGELTPVLSYGSNRSPDQLRRKFGSGGDHPILSVKATLSDFDIVRSAHFTAYGTLAATVFPSKGTKVEVFLQFFDEQSLQQLHRSEALGRNYEFKRLQATLLIGSEDIGSVLHYRSLHGCFLQNSSPIAFSELPAQHRILQEQSQPELLAAAHARLAAGTDCKAWLMRIASDKEYRRAMTARIKTLS